MGGNKPERELAGKSLLNHSLAWAMAHSDEVAIAVRAKEQVAEQPMVPLLIDRIGGIGPISALDSAFRFAAQQGRETVMLMGCDLPFLPSNLPLMLQQQIGANGCAMPVSHGRDHPMAALWRVDCAALADYIDGGGQSLWRFADAVGVTRVDWGDGCDPDTFANINDPAALAKAESQLSPRSD
jgi:molybdopterin-guanine dinucleotide biosynthesis protein A